MTTKTDTPFKPGARVAVFASILYGHNVTEAFVDKVYKNGNFTLRGDKHRQQWRPYRSYGYGGPNRWQASRTGEGYTRQSLELWTPETDKSIKVAMASAKRAELANDIRAFFGRFSLNKSSDAVNDKLLAACAEAISEYRSGIVKSLPKGDDDD